MHAWIHTCVHYMHVHAMHVHYTPLSLCSHTLLLAGNGYHIGDQRLMTDFDELATGGYEGPAWGPGDEGLMSAGYEDGTYDEQEMRNGYV